MTFLRVALTVCLGLVSPARAAMPEPLSLEAARKSMPTRETAKRDYRESVLVEIQKGFRFPEGVSREARETVPRVIGEMLRGMPPESAARVLACRPGVVVVPDGKRPTDYAPFSSLRSHRALVVLVRWPYEGGTEVDLPDGSEWVAIKDETFSNKSDWPQTETAIAHEWAHVVHRCALKRPQAEIVDRLYDSHQASDKRFPTRYAATDKWEYFADSAAVWFGVREAVGEEGGETYLGADWILKFDPRMYSLLEAVFGPPRDIAQ